MKDYFLIGEKAERKRKVNKFFLIGISVIIVVSVSSIAGILFAKSKNEKKISEYLDSNNVEQEKNTEQQADTKEIKTFSFPVYSEDAKNKIIRIYQEDNDDKIAYLTFDDGPSENITPQILEILKNEEIKATFFVLGNNVKKYSEIVKREFEEGHYIANHGYSHEYSKIYASKEAVLDEYNKTEKIIQEALETEEYHTYLFRFPGGSEGGKYKNIKNEAKALLEENNIAYINWNALTNDAVGNPTGETIINDLKATVGDKKRVVVLMHDSNSKQLTAETLPDVINYLRDEGFQFGNFYDIMK